MLKWLSDIYQTQFIDNTSVFHGKSNSFGQHRLLNLQCFKWNIKAKLKKSAAMDRNCTKLSFLCGSSVERDINQGAHYKSSAEHRLQEIKWKPRTTQANKKDRNLPAELVGIGM